LTDQDALPIALRRTLGPDETLICAIFTEDDRYSVPTVSIVPLNDLSAARAFAECKLRSSSHYLKIEARCDDELLFILCRDDVAWELGTGPILPLERMTD
jgi:hypothetical protein